MIEDRRRCVDRDHPELSIVPQCELPGLPRSSWYYVPVGESAENLVLMRRIDAEYLQTPFYGSRKLAAVEVDPKTWAA